MILAIFFGSAAILAFELISAQLVGFILGNGYSLVVISIAMLGMSFAASLLSAFPFKPAIAESRRMALLTLFMALSILVVYVGVFFMKEDANRHLSQQLSSAVTMADVNMLSAHFSIVLSLGVGLLMAIPYFIFGLILTLALQCTPKERIAKLYGFDLFGAAFGGAAAFMSMEQGSFALMVVLPIALCLLSMSCFLNALNLGKFKALLPLVASMICLVVIYAQAWRFEPRAESHSAARDSKGTATVTDVWHGWSSYSRVALFRIREAGQVFFRVVIGNGSGHATLLTYPFEAESSQFPPVLLMTALGIPQRALILLAGTGAEMVVLDHITNGQTHIKGVELNPRVRDAALQRPELNMAAFYDKSNCEYVIDEARSNLEQDKSKYDVILFSWSGATNAYYTGNIGATVQYVYTKEAMQSALSHLTPQGYLIVLNTKKSRIVAMLKSLFGPSNLSNTVMLIRDPYHNRDAGKPDKSGAAVWDNDILLVKPSGFSPNEVAMLTEKIRQLKLTIRYAPGASDQTEEHLLTGLLQTSNLQSFISQYNKTSSTPLFVAEDDRPFILLRSFVITDLKGAQREVAEAFKWLNLKTATLGKSSFALIISIIAFLVIMTPPLLARGVPGNLKPGLVAYFVCLGAGFMFVEVGMINQLNLLVGSPGLALTVVLCGLISSSGAGSLFGSNRLNAGATTVAAAALVLYLGCVYLFAGNIIHLALAWSTPSRVILSLAFTLPAGFLMGLFLPRGLTLCAQDDPRLLPLAWAINGAVGTSAAAWSWALSENMGFRSLVLTGALFYAGIFVLLRQRQSALNEVPPQPNLQT